MKTASKSIRSDDDFPVVSKAVRTGVSSKKPPFFRTAATNLFATYLTGFDLGKRQTYNCHACRRFLEQYGDLVTIGEDGHAASVFWSGLSNVPAEYDRSIDFLRQAVEKSPVEGVFFSSEIVWGTGDTHDKKRDIEWSHFEIASPSRFTHPLKSAAQAMAEAREELGMIERGLAEFPRDAVAKAKTLLETEQLYRSEKTLGVATWLLNLHDAVAATKHEQRRRNILWRAVALAPPGFAHVKSTMIGTLLEDIVSGMDFEAVKRRFADKMHPLQYQRAQVPPSDGNIAEAEKIIAKLRTAGALDRRFARLEDIQALWKPTKAKETEKAGGVFGHLKTKQEQADASDVGGAVTMTWEKFARLALPSAEKIEMLVPAHGNFTALITAANPDAPPMLQWDREDRRNPVSWYVYNGGSPSAGWNLMGGSWNEVSAITLLPSMWGEQLLKHQGEGVILILDGARDIRHQRSGGFFTETLRSEYHAIRRTLEAYMMNATVDGKEEATACGYDLRKGGPINVTVRMTSKGIRTRYLIDRWD